MSERREVAIYLRKGTLWVADFIDGDGALVDAATWFRFNCGALSTYHARRRMVRESAIPLSQELVTRIENLHCPTAAAESDRAVPPRDAASGAIARFLHRVFRRRSTHQAGPVERGDARSEPFVVAGAARIQPVGALHEIELHSCDENGR